MFTKATIIAALAAIQITQVNAALRISDVYKAGGSTGRNCSPIPACQFVWDPPMSGCEGGKIAMAEIATNCQELEGKADVVGYGVGSCPGYTMDIKRFGDGQPAQVLLFKDGNLVGPGDAKWKMTNCKTPEAGSIGCTTKDGGCDAEPTT